MDRSTVVLALALGLGACTLLPDRVFVEARESPVVDSNWGEGDYLASVGVEYDLRPQKVEIASQTTPHPWDLGGLIGLYDSNSEPMPLVVEDEQAEDMIGELRILNEAIVELTKTNRALAEDARTMREGFQSMENAWNDVNRTLLGGGGLTSLILLLLGSRKLKQRHEDRDV